MGRRGFRGCLAKSATYNRLLLFTWTIHLRLKLRLVWAWDKDDKAARASIEG